MDVVVFSLGLFVVEVFSWVYVGGYFGCDDYWSFCEDYVIGDVVIVFFCVDGLWCDICVNVRVMGFGFDWLCCVL